MAQSKAHIKASNKYNKEHYAKVQANINKETYNGLCAFCHVSGMSKAQLISNATKEYVYSKIESGELNANQVSEIANAYGVTFETETDSNGSVRYFIKANQPTEDVD